MPRCHGPEGVEKWGEKDGPQIQQQKFFEKIERKNVK
jgi:hypothetical protein